MFFGIDIFLIDLILIEEYFFVYFSVHLLKYMNKNIDINWLITEFENYVILLLSLKFSEKPF